MGAKPSKSIDNQILRSFHTYHRKKNQLRHVLKRKKAKSISSPAPSLNANQLTDKSTENEITKTSDSTINNTEKTTNMRNNTCNNNNVLDSGSIKRSSPSSNNNAHYISKKSRREKTCSFASNTTDSRHVSLINSNTTSDIGMYSNKSTISSDCWTTLSNDPFSQIEVNTSAFTEITDQSTISRKSLLYPVFETLEPATLSNQQFLQSELAITAHHILSKLNSHPAQVHLILNEAYHRAREQNDVNDWTEFYTALDQYASQPTTPPLSKNTSLVYLARCFIFGLGVDKDINHGLKLLESHPSCETTYALGKFYLDGLPQADDGTCSIDKAKAFDCIKTASEYTIMNESMLAAVSEAQCTLARILFQGEGVARNSHQALNYLIQSAENDNMYAQFLIGVHYERGFEIDRDLEKAKFYYKKSADSGFPDAQAALGSRLIAESNYSEGIEWLEKSVQKGNSRAHVQLGILYDKGEGVPQNNDMALLHYKVAVENNNPAAQYILGLVYYFGRLGRQKNYKDAIRLIKQSAMAGLPYAQRVLGQLYQLGNVITATQNRNDREAIRWFRRASSGGDVAALGILGKCFELGKGVEIDLKKALAFYAKAADTNSPYICYAYIDQARILQKMSRHPEAFSIYNKVLSIGNPNTDIKSIQTAECSVARYHLCCDIEGIQYNPVVAYNMLLKLTASTSDPLAHYWLGSIYDEGIPGLVEIQREKAFDHFVIAADSGDNDATFLVAYMLSNYVIPGKGPSDAFVWYEKAAMKGHPTSMYSLGLCYYKGIGQDKPDFDLATEWFEKAVRYGVSDALPYIARTHLKQTVIHANDPEVAQQFFEKTIAALKLAVENNDVYSQRELGKIYLTGQGVNTDYSLAVELLKKAAAKNDAEALTFLGDCYQKGVGVQKDIQVAIEHYSQAAKLGYPYAYSAAAELYYEVGNLEDAYDQYLLASKDPRIMNTDVGKTARMMVARLALGDLPSVRNNPSSFDRLITKKMISVSIAFESLSTLAIQDRFIPAFQPLGSCYLYGTGTEVNEVQALFWLQKSIEEDNDSVGFFHLSYMYSIGFGVAKDESLALEYLNKSADLGYSEAQYHMGIVYFEGKYGVSKNECIAASWFKRAASRSHSQSVWMLSEMASLIDQNELELQYQKTAASFGHVLAMRMLGQKYLKQLDVPFLNALMQNQYLEEALKYLHMAGDANDIESLVLLGKTYMNGTKTKVKFSAIVTDQPFLPTPGSCDDECNEGQSQYQSEEDEKMLAIQCFTKAADLGDIDATLYAAEAWYEEKQYAAALELFEKAANHGNVTARFFRARYYIEGHAGCSLNPEKGFEELLMCANDLNCVHAYNTLGQCYENGIGTTKDDHLAYKWYTRAAEATNDAEAYYRVGMMYLQRKLPSDIQHDLEALKYFDLAVNVTHKNHGPSCYRLGLYYLNGIHDDDTTVLLAPDVCLSIEYFRTAADLNVPEAMLQLGLLFLQDDGDTYSVDDQEEGLSYMLRAADMSYCEAQFELGIVYHYGNILVPQNFEKAYDLFCRSASQQHPTATYYLGIYHEHGIFVTPEPSIALDQYELAVELFETQYETSPDRWMVEYNLARILHYDIESRARAYRLFQVAHAHAPQEFKLLLKITIARYHLHGWGGVSVQEEQAVHSMIEFAQDKQFGHLVYLELAQCFESGTGVAQNLRQAFHWYGEVLDKAQDRHIEVTPFVFLDEELEQDEGTAMFKLAEFYQHGVVVKQDLKRAADLYRLAAQKECPAALDYMLNNKNS